MELTFQGLLLYAMTTQGLIGGDQFGNAAVTTGGVWYVINSDDYHRIMVHGGIW